MNMIKSILIVEDHAVMRIGTELIIKQSNQEMHVEGASTFEEALNALLNKKFDLVILDINIPGGNNLKMIDAIREIRPSIYILVFSSYDEQLYALPYLQAGANGYLSKGASQEELLVAIERIGNNRKYLSPALQEDTIASFLQHGKKSIDPIGALSKREMDVANLLVKGYGTAEIGKMLDLQISTVSTFKSRIFTKLQVKNLVELISKMSMLQTLDA